MKFWTSTKINDDEIGENEEGSDMYIGRKGTEDEAIASSRNEANPLKPRVRACNKGCSRNHL